MLIKEIRNMAAEVARKLVEKAGIDVNKLLDLLVKNAAAEFTTYYYYSILRQIR